MKHLRIAAGRGQIPTPLASASSLQSPVAAKLPPRKTPGSRSSESSAVSNPTASIRLPLPISVFPFFKPLPTAPWFFLGEPGVLGEAVRTEIQHVDPGIPVFSVRTMDAVISTFLAERRFALELLGLFAGVALLLASVGIYGVMAYTFSRRTNEIGIRIAMGAQRTDIFRMALEEGAVTIALGVGAGLLGALALTRFLESMRFSVRATDPLTFGAIAALLAAVTLLACLLSAERATHVHPLVALRRY
jgi:hypothetical protein